MKKAPAKCTRRFDCRWAAVALGSVLVSACASAPRLQPHKDLLVFISDGHSTCADVIVHLGDPSQQYEQGRLLTYRIAEDDQGRYAVVSRHDWSQARYSLVVSCGTDGILVRHALVAVKGGP